MDIEEKKIIELRRPCSSYESGDGGGGGGGSCCNYCIF